VLEVGYYPFQLQIWLMAGLVIVPGLEQALGATYTAASLKLIHVHGTLVHLSKGCEVQVVMEITICAF
jgi:hypothetical protein